MIRIGILTYFASINYGAFLQAYALQKSLENRYGHIAEIEIIHYDSKISHDFYLNRISMADAAASRRLSKQYEAFLQDRKKMKLSEDELVTDNIDALQHFLQGKYDIIIAGSDEIWKTNSLRGFPNAYWLNFDLGKTVYMAYAVSGRSDYSGMDEDMKKYIRNSMSRFAYIGTRDETTKKELLKINDEKEINRNCDPCFLMPQLFRLSDTEKKNIRKKYGAGSSMPMISIMIKNTDVGSRLYRMLKYDNHVKYLYNVNGTMGEDNLTEVSPFEWSHLIAASDLVITDFFHGTVFSILHRVPFISLEGEEKGRGKIENLLLENNMNDKFVYRRDYSYNKVLALDLYTRGRKAMREHVPDISEKAVAREARKSNTFFSELDMIVENMKNLM